MKRILVFSAILLLLLTTLNSCGGRRMGAGKQKKNCNCGF